MTFRVVHLVPAPEPGDSVLVDGRPHVVVSLLSHHARRRPAARVSPDLPCGVCDTALEYDPPRGQWWCPLCRTGYDRETLAGLVAEHAAEGASEGRTRRRGVARGAPGAAAVLLRAATEGGAPGKHELFRRVAGAERRALQRVLRDDGVGPLTAERCREAAAALDDTVA